MSKQRTADVAPGSYDVAALMQAVEQHHHVRLTFVLSADVSRPGVLEYSATATEQEGRGPGRTVLGEAGRRRWAVSGQIVQLGAPALFSYVYGVMMQLDGLLSVERWEQLPLEEAEGAP